MAGSRRWASGMLEPRKRNFYDADRPALTDRWRRNRVKGGGRLRSGGGDPLVQLGGRAVVAPMRDLEVNLVAVVIRFVMVLGDRQRDREQCCEHGREKASLWIQGADHVRRVSGSR